MTQCPKCDFQLTPSDTQSCPRCGVYFSKLYPSANSAQHSPALTAHPQHSASSTSSASSSLSLSSDGNPLLKRAIAALVIGLLLWQGNQFLSHRQHAKIEANEVILAQSLLVAQGSQKVIVYGTPETPATYAQLELLKLYGFEAEVTLITDGSQIPNLKAYQSRTHQSEKRVDIPLAEFSDQQLMGASPLRAALSLYPTPDLSQGKTKPYIILYGIENCGYTQAYRTEFDQKKIPYQYININSSAAQNMGVIMARELVSGKKAEDTEKNGMKTPFLEINGQILERPSSAEFAKAYNNQL